MASKLTKVESAFTLPVRPNKEDIAKGVPTEFDSCPIARQLVREAGNRFRRWRDVSARVSVNFVHLKAKIGKSEDETTFIALNTPENKEFINAFDNGKPVQPGFRGVLTFQPDT